ncbi:MAG: hypothetical protein EXS35_17315 [Pedosphaera sp.]|nr:hypothetical protein [Pedosphaera sp.]
MYYNKSPLVIALAAVVLVLLFTGLAAWHFVSNKSTGIPLGPAVRLPHHISQILQTTERYLPTLHRNPDKDRFRLDLLLISLTDPTKQETITLLRQQQRNALQPMTKILGGTGNVVWVQALDLFAVNLETKRVLRSSDFTKLNPELAVFLTSARCEFKDQLIVVSPDQRKAYAIDATTFKAESVPVPKNVGWINPNATPESLLCAGGLLASNEWFGVLTAKDLASDFKTGFRVPLDCPVNLANESRRLYRGRLDASAPRPRIEAMEPISDLDYQNCALVRDAKGVALLRLATPDSVLLTHRSSTDSGGTLLVTRLEPNGKTGWTADTGIGLLEQVLPDERIIAFIGTRPAVPNKVPEPILVLLNTSTGGMTTHSLWR